MTAEAKYSAIENLLNSLGKEGVDIEFKEASDALPKSIWETVSAFANTNGGVLILGIKEEHRSFTVAGVHDAAKMESDFWNTIRNRKKISSLSIDTDAFEILKTRDGKEVVRITIPQASFADLPVYLNGEMSQAYIRRGEGNYLASADELKTLIRNGSTKSLDRTPLKGLSIDALDRNALGKFKTMIEARYPEGAFEDMKMQDFLLHLGLLDDSVPGDICVYSGTLLLFGRYNIIKRYFDSYQIDYFDYRGSDERWSDRVSTDDLLPQEMNLFNFYEIVSQKLSATAKSGFKLDENMIRVNTDMTQALREALVNTFVHADYSIPNSSIRIEVFDTYYKFENPGKMLIPVDKFFRGGMTKSRNDVLMSVFRRLGLSERQGYGGYQIFKAVSNNMLRSPQIITSLEKTSLTIWLVDLPGSYSELTGYEKDILSIVTHAGVVSKSDISSMLGDRYSEYQIKKALKNLVDSNILAMTGKGRAVRYSINISTAEGLGQIRYLVDRITELLQK